MTKVEIVRLLELAIRHASLRVASVNDEQEYQLSQRLDFIRVEQYQYGYGVMPNEIGRTKEARYVRA